MRKLEKIQQPGLYYTDFDVSQDVESPRGTVVSESEITGNELYSMRNGETRLDKVKKREVTRIDGNLFKKYVNEDGEVKLIELE